MNKGFYIGGIVLSLILFILSVYYISEINDARYQEFFDMMQSDYNYGYYGLSTVASDLTMEIASISLVFFLFYIASDLLGLIKIKTTTTKVFSIIGLSITFIFLLWDFAVLSSPSAMSFDEVGIAWLLYAIIMLAFSIVGLVQSIRFGKGSSQLRSDVLDS
ncbi:hypothetical protein N9089_00125 [Crocinitomicaceae bacterium]|nr:hypothetical protein [Crocinitomicaceae bacterium]